MKTVLRALDDFAGNSRDCCVGQRRIAEWGDLSPRQVRSALRILEEAGLVETELRNSRRGRVANRFSLQWKALAELAPGTEWPAAELSAGLPAPPDPEEVLLRPEPSGKSRRGPRKVSPGAPESLAGDLNRLCINRLYEPPPPSPSPPSPEPQDAWGRAEEELVALGMGEHAMAIAMARSSGCPPEFVLSTVELYRSRPGWWLTPGAIFQRLKIARPEQDPSELTFWPKPDPAAKQRFDDAQRQRAEAAERHREREESAAREEAKAARIAADRERLARFTADELLDLVDSTLSEAIRPLCRKLLIEKGPLGLAGSLLAGPLLAACASRQGNSTEGSG
jgi:DNA-binding transcriptional ArsR family regulator